MTINITPFEDIANINLKESMEESPLKDFSFQEGLFHKEDGSFLISLITLTFNIGK